MLHHDSTPLVQSATGGLGEFAAEMGGAHACCPDHSGGLDSTVSVRGADDDFPWTHGLHAALGHEFDPIALQ